ncbi:MAG: hypothetical protein GY874_18090, partial [Desulfobacteraceae bacterium]|nr:hypothetical protein [Desulfobacteraceae bacterium]
MINAGCLQIIDGQERGIQTITSVGWDNPEVTPPEKCRYDACITVPEQTKVDGEVGLQKIPSGSYAVYRV